MGKLKIKRGSGGGSFARHFGFIVVMDVFVVFEGNTCKIEKNCICLQSEIIITVV